MYQLNDANDVCINIITKGIEKTYIEIKISCLLKNKQLWHDMYKYILRI